MDRTSYDGSKDVLGFQTYYDDPKVASLQSAFNRVVNPTNWKNRIDTIITTMTADPAGELAEIREAVIFYTGSVPTFTKGQGDFRIVRVQAAGYYATIGA